MMSILIVKNSFHRAQQNIAAVCVDFDDNLVDHGREVLFAVAVRDFVNVVRACAEHVGQSAVDLAAVRVADFKPEQILNEVDSLAEIDVVAVDIDRLAAQTLCVLDGVNALDFREGDILVRTALYLNSSRAVRVEVELFEGADELG